MRLVNPTGIEAAKRADFEPRLGQDNKLAATVSNCHSGADYMYLVPYFWAPRRLQAGPIQI
jgi:hypothetical protein